MGDLIWLLSLHEELKTNRENLRVHAPLEAWIDAANLEQAYMEYERQPRLTASLIKKEWKSSSMARGMTADYTAQVKAEVKLHCLRGSKADN